MRTKSTIIFLTIVLLVIGVGAMAADEMLTGKIESVTVAKDTNGNEYVRLILPITANLNGIDYQKSVPVMAFREHAAQAKLLKAGDQLKCIASYREYQGRQSYTILKFLK